VNPNAEAAVVMPVGGTGHWPAPGGDPPVGTNHLELKSCHPKEWINVINPDSEAEPLIFAHIH
jgi:hypothetical protein